MPGIEADEASTAIPRILPNVDWAYVKEQEKFIVMKAKISPRGALRRRAAVDRPVFSQRMKAHNFLDERMECSRLT